MAITAKWTAQCDGCDVVKEKEFPVENADAEFSLGTIMDKEICLRWMHGEGKIFHSRDCCYQWLVSQGRLEDAEKLNGQEE